MTLEGALGLFCRRTSTFNEIINENWGGSSRSEKQISVSEQTQCSASEKAEKPTECVSRTEQLWWSAKTRNEGRKRNKEQFK